MANTSKPRSLWWAINERAFMWLVSLAALLGGVFCGMEAYRDERPAMWASGAVTCVVVASMTFLVGFAVEGKRSGRRGK